MPMIFLAVELPTDVLAFIKAMDTLVPSAQRCFSPCITDLSSFIVMDVGTPLSLAMTMMAWSCAFELFVDDSESNTIKSAGSI